MELVAASLAYPAFAITFVVGTLLAYTIISLIGGS
jgi:hypothetical protein